MEVVCLCPFVATSFVWQAHTGAYARTLIVKATFVLQQGNALLASEQEAILDRDRHEGDDPSVHRIVVESESKGLIRRQPDQARSIELLVPPDALPPLREP